MVIIENPAFEVDGVYDQRVIFPPPHGISIVRRLDSFAVRTPIRRNDAGRTL